VTKEELRKEIEIEFEQITEILRELASLSNDLAFKEPTVREKTAAAAFLAQFYSGIENVLKRISHFNRVSMPSGETWHVELFKRFCMHANESLPVLFDEGLALEMAPYRKFRHVFHHSYGMNIDWIMVKDGVENIDEIFRKFRNNVTRYFNSLDK
jgi:hypothetical protein